LATKPPREFDEMDHAPGKREGRRLRQGRSSAVKSTLPRLAQAPQGGGASLPAWDPAAPLACLNREAGLAAIAAELHLQISTLDRDLAEAIERGAAALFLAGYGPRPTKVGQTVDKATSDAAKGRRSSDRGRAMRAAPAAT